MVNSCSLKSMARESGRDSSVSPVVVNNSAGDKKQTGMKSSSMLMKSSSMMLLKQMWSSQAHWTRVLMTNPGVSENSDSTMKPSRNAPSSTLNATIREPLSNFALSHLISEETMFLQQSDPLESHHRAELPCSRKLISVARRSCSLKVNPASITSISLSSN